MVFFDTKGAERDPARAKTLERLGFRFGEKGTHTSRTMMLAELEALLESLSPMATRDQFRAAVI